MKIKTGCEIFNELLGGYRNTTLLYGAAATGKTTIAKIAAIEQAKNGKKVIFMDTENEFNIERFKQLAGENYKELLENILLFRINSFKDQQLKIKNVKEICKKASLVIIDSIGNRYRTLVKSKPVLANRMLISQVRMLNDISKDIPVIITNQVYTSIKDNSTRVVGGEIIRESCTYLIELEKNENRKAILKKPINREINFEIKENGLFRV